MLLQSEPIYKETESWDPTVEKVDDIMEDFLPSENVEFLHMVLIWIFFNESMN